MFSVRFSTLCIVCLAVVLALAALPAQAANKAVKNSSRTTNQLTFPPVPDESHRIAANSLLQQIWQAQPGQPQFEAINAVVEKFKQSDKATQEAIAWLCLTAMHDKNRPLPERWTCEYVLSFPRYEPAIPHLIDILLHDEVETMRGVAAEALGFWYKSTGNTDIYNVLMQSATTDPSKWVQETLAKYLSGPVVTPNPAIALPPAPDEAHRTAAESILQQIWNAQPGQPKFDAISAVAQKYRQSDTATKNAITWLCLANIYDKNRGVIDRWPCEYVLSYVNYGPAIPHLIYVLLHDDVEAMRAVAAEALGMWYKSTGNNTIYDALVQSAKTDSSKWVQETLAKYLTSNPPTSNSDFSK